MVAGKGEVGQSAVLKAVVERVHGGVTVEVLDFTNSMATDAREHLEIEMRARLRSLQQAKLGVLVVEGLDDWLERGRAPHVRTSIEWVLRHVRRGIEAPLLLLCTSKQPWNSRTCWAEDWPRDVFQLFQSDNVINLS